MTAPHDSPIQNFEAPIQKIEAPIQNTEAPIQDGGRREERRRVYFNIPQREVMATACRDTVVVGGRGIGKGVIHAAWNLRNMQRMAGSSTGKSGSPMGQTRSHRPQSTQRASSNTG